MENIFDICSFFVHKGIRDDIPISQLKLQKLLYFSQGFYIAQHNQPLFKNSIYAWKYGPVVKEVYEKFRYFGNNFITLNNYSSILSTDFIDRFRDLDNDSKYLLNFIWDNFSSYSAFELVELTHVPDSPWYNIYKKYNGNPPDDTTIPINDIKSYFLETYFN